MKKALIIFGILGCLLSTFAFDDPEDEELTDEEILATYERLPPKAIRYTVQQLFVCPDNAPEGANVVLRIQYENDGRAMPAQLNIYSGSTYTLFRDDGTAPDVTEGDRIYSGYVTQDLQEFADKVHIF